MKRLADGIGTGGAGVRDDAGWAMDFQMPRHFGELALGLIGLDEGELLMATGCWQQSVFVILLADRHRGGGSADDERHFSAIQIGGLESLQRGENREPGAAIHALPGTFRDRGNRRIFRQIDLTGGADALAGDVEKRDRLKRGFSGAEAVEIFRPIHPERRHDPAARDHDGARFGRGC